MNQFSEWQGNRGQTNSRRWMESMVFGALGSAPAEALKKYALAFRALLATALLSASLFAQVNPPGDPLHVDTLSTSSTLPGADGLRLVSASFRITNTRTSSITPPSPAIATIAFGTNSASLAVPALPPGATAYVSRTVETASQQVAISIAITAQPPVTETNSILPAPKPIAKPTPTRAPKVTAAAATAPILYTVDVAGDPGRWQSVGPFEIASSPPETGRVTTIAIDPRNPEIVYAGARGSGLWRTLGIRTVWLPLTDSLPSQEIEALALDPNNPDHVVIATGAGVFESFNDGSVWTLLNSTDLHAIGSDGGKLLIARGPNPAMLVTTTSGVFVSTDGGHTWTSILSSTSQGNSLQASSIQFSSTDPTQLFATLGSTNGPGPQPGVYRASNGGIAAASWHQLQGCPSAPLPSFPLSSNVWIAESHGSIWVSYRAGAADNDQLGILRSTSVTCTVNGFPENGWQTVSLSSDCSAFTNNWSYLFVDPNDPSIVYKGGVNLCRITGSGASSSIMSNIHEDQHAIAVAPSNPSLVYFGSDGGIYRSDDQGNTLSFAGQGMSNTEFLKADVDGTGIAIVGASQDNDVQSWDGSSSSVWKSEVNYLDGVLVAIDQANPAGIYWMSQSTRQIFRYETSSPQIGDAALNDCLAYNETPELFVGMVSTGATPAIYTTCTGLWTGPPWKQVQTASGNFTRLGFINGSHGMVAAATDTGDVFYGIAGQPPLAQAFHSPNPASASSITFANQSTFYVSMNAGPSSALQGVIYRLQCSAGCTSENAWPGYTNGEILAITVDPLVPDTLLAAIRNNGVFRGVRASTGVWTWAPYNNGLPAAITITDLKASRNGSIAAVSFGRGAYTLTTTGVIVPNLLSLPEKEATAALSMLGLVPKVVFQKACVNPGDVLSQSPGAGGIAAPNSTVNITVDSGTSGTCIIK